MVKVYLEDGKSADLIALFEDEDDYNNCVSSLEDNANESGFTITESITAEPLSDLLPVKSYIEDRIKELEGEYDLNIDLYWDPKYTLQTDEVLCNRTTRLQYQIEELNLILKNCVL